MRAKLLAILAMVLFAASYSFAQQTPVEVTVAYASAIKDYQTLTLTGTIESSQDALLAPLESGVVSKLFVEVGDKVEQGASLLLLDDKLAQLTTQQAKANFKAAEVALEEAKRLFQEADTLSKQQLAAKTLREERITNVASAEAELSRQQANLDFQQEIVKRHMLRAPFSGVIYQRQVDVGEWITPANGVLALVSQQDIRLSIEVPQEYYGVFSKLNVPIRVVLDGRNHSIVMGHIETLVGVSNSQTRSFTAHIALPTDVNLLIGMSAKAEIKLPDTEKTAFWLPVSALKQHPDGGVSVFSVVNKRAKRVLIEVIQQRGNAVLVSNAQADLAYVTSGVELITDNTEVKISDGSPAL